MRIGMDNIMVVIIAALGAGMVALYFLSILAVLIFLPYILIT